jgi:putative transposase
MATRARHTPEQVVCKLTQADRMLVEGKEVADVCRELQVSEQTYDEQQRFSVRDRIVRIRLQ